MGKSAIAGMLSRKRAIVVEKRGAIVDMLFGKGVIVEKRAMQLN
jgi:hypothetical protein